MASLKEIRGRINSISTTLKITDVTQMIASAKLHKTQLRLKRYRLYYTKIADIFYDFLRSGELSDTPLTENRPTEKIAIIAFASNSSLCGAFNLNAIKKTNDVIQSYLKTIPPENITLYAIGKKMYDAFSQEKHIKVKGPYYELSHSPNYDGITPLTEELMDQFLKNEIDKVDVIYNKFKNILTQHITEEVLLPLEIPEAPKKEKGIVPIVDYIVEPDRFQLVNFLAPQIVRLSLFGHLLESAAAEYAARSTAMQTATENANELIEELTKEYNRVRQAAITKEIIDIVGGAEAV